MSTPFSIRSNDIEAFLDVSANVKVRLKDGIHIQHPNGNYTFWKLRDFPIHKVILEAKDEIDTPYLLEVEIIEEKK